MLLFLIGHRELRILKKTTLLLLIKKLNKYKTNGHNKLQFIVLNGNLLCPLLEWTAKVL